MLNNVVHDKREGDFATIVDLIGEKLNLEDEGKRPTALPSEMQKCSKILRYALKNMISHRSPYDALIIDGIWKLLLLNMETLLQFAIKTQSSCAEEMKRNYATTQGKIKDAVERLELREKEIELEYTMKKEEYEAKISSLASDKAKLSEVLEATKVQIEDLMDTSRFMHVHYFLTEFQYKLESSYEGHLSRLRITRNMLQLLIKEDNLMKELNEELSTKEMPFPKYIINILRKLQTQLDIRLSELRSVSTTLSSRIKKLLGGTFDAREVVHVKVQTNPLAAFKAKVSLRTA
eukprot:TRINITY_DN7116_c0_g2_i3.p1 TRINITY_DN7116_c0_g2~~TRINITY_DN7116_c0_g2_i3.p1  ORF type:complete len:291 (-),score=87.35 TRINITY_DN7116_c0_g2_i3:1951-2823(-)